jgi:hypothetical protein
MLFLSDWVYRVNSTLPVNDPINIAPAGFSTLKLYEGAESGALVALVGKVDPASNQITGMVAVVRGTRLSEYGPGTIQDMISNISITSGNRLVVLAGKYSNCGLANSASP